MSDHPLFAANFPRRSGDTCQFLTVAVFAFVAAVSLPLLGRLALLSKNPIAKGLFVISECQKPAGTSEGTEFECVIDLSPFYRLTNAA
jgi:hypothetical protein